MDKSKVMDTWMRRSALRGLSIQQRLPLFICILLLCIMVAFSWVSYIGVKKATLKSGQDRLNTLTTQFSEMLTQSAQVGIAASRGTASMAPIKECLKNLDPNVCTEAFLALEKVRQDSTTIFINLLNADRKPVLFSSKGAIETRVNFDSLLIVYFKKDTSGVGKIYQVKDSMYYPLVTPVYENNKKIGYIARWRFVGSTPEAMDRLSQILGTKAKFYIANNDKSLWTDMMKPIANPISADARLNASFFEYEKSDGSKVIATERQIKNTPWLILIEFSQQTVLEAANRFLRWIIIIAIAMVAIGSFVAWIMSRNITRPLNKLTAAVSSIASGNDSPAVAVERRDEVGKLARAFNAMTIQVHNAKKDLEQKVIEAEQMSEQLRDLSAHLQNIREQERIHIAREMHDELGQLLTSFKMDVSWLNKKLSAGNDPVIQEKLVEMSSIVDGGVTFVRKIAAELRPSILDDLGLIPALEWHSKEFQKRFDIEVEFNSKIEDLETSGLVATGLFRMYQESLTNVARHSGAKKVKSSLETSATHIRLAIADDGKGFDTKGTNGERKTLGLLRMKERALMIGGTLDIISEPGKGTRVLIKVPKNEV